MNIFGVGPAEAGLVFVIALIVVGPQRFPEIMRQAGRWYRMARAYSNEVMKDVRSAVDDIEREVKAETDDLRSVGELADVRQDLRQARNDAEEIHRDTRSVFRDESKSVRPSQRAAGTDEAIPPIERGTADDTTEVEPLKKPREVAKAAPSERPGKTGTPEKAAETFDPFKREKPKKGPVLIPRETAPSEDDEPTS